MLLRIPRLLSAEEVAGLRDVAARGDFVDGSSRAGQGVRSIKSNEQLAYTRDQVRQVNDIMRQAMERSRRLQFFAWPRQINTPIISRYTPGMEYGSHVDNPILFRRDGEPLRSDLSMTVFLSPAESYDGGELELETPFGLQTVKMDAGDALVYATTLRHRVTPVTRGTRLAAVTWIQSLVKESEKRQILFDLAQANDAVREGPKEASEPLSRSFTNLIKMWAEV